MRSRAHFKGHPLHPALVALPIAFLYAAPIADLLGRLLTRPTLHATGAYLSIAAVATGLLAAVPGLIDYLHAVPPDSSAKKRATSHMAVNVAALLLVVIGFLFRDWSTLTATWPVILLELAAAALVTWGGWLGGTLVYRNQIAVDHRYAHAGKWREITVDGSPGQTIPINDAADLKPGQMILLRWRDRRLVLARTDDGFAAFDDRCTHRGGPLADGVLTCGVVACPWHGSQFDVSRGAVKAGPATASITAYRVEHSDGWVAIDLSAPTTR
jgi:nitrite reductase/ring-hydroxylating ferredoxin subunit/uncharacterized membrane protein